MHKRFWSSAASALLCAAISSVPGSAWSANEQEGGKSYELTTRWSLLKEGEAEGNIEQDAKHPARDAEHLLRIQATKTAGPGKGRVGATSSTPIEVREGQWYDASFSATTERGSIGLVFSLESADGKVLARTTLPEIGRGRGPRGASAPEGAWTKYTVALHARGSDPKAHLVITPIEPTNVWIEGLRLTERGK
jgi:hypothetical protein